MNTKDTQPTSADAIVTAEFEAMLVRCEAAGVSREEATSILAIQSALASAARWADEDRARREAAAQTPVGQALQKAWELRHQASEIRVAGILPDRAEFNAACAEYLRLAHNAGAGDTLEIHGWAKPRTIRLETFHLSFYSDENPRDAMMWFDGEPVRGCPKNRSSSIHGCLLDTRVYKR